MSGEADEQSGSRQSNDRWAWLRKLGKRRTQEVINHPEAGKVDMAYFLKLCGTGVPRELNSGHVQPTQLVDIYGKPVLDNELPVTVVTDATAFYQILQQKKSEAEENLEGILPAVSVGEPEKHGKTAKGLPIVIEVVDVPGERQFRLWSVEETGAWVEKYNEINETTLGKDYPSVNLVVGMPGK